MGFDYDSNATETPTFDKFLSDLSGGHNNSKLYLLSLLNVIVTSQLNYHIIIFLHGPAASGKTVLTTLLKALVGHESVMSSTLEALSSDHCEVSNFPGKKMILVNDTNGILRDSATLKAFSGMDELRGRAMFQGITTSVEPEGVIVIVGNESLSLDKPDYNDGFTRRIRPYETSLVSNSRTPLIEKIGNKFSDLNSQPFLTKLFFWTLYV